MTSDIFNAEREAQRSLMEFYERAEECRLLFERANIPLPEALKRVLGMNGSGAKQTSQPIIPPPDRPSMPPDATSDWIWIRAKEATPNTLVLALLRAAGGVLRSKDVTTKMQAILPDVSRGTISNVGTRLKGTAIELTDDGWRLIDMTKAGILHKGYLWGHPDSFGKTELAAQRRDAILHVLGMFDSGLQIVQIVENLRRCAWVVAPINKDLLKDDIAILLAQGKIRRRGNTKKWELAPPVEEG